MESARPTAKERSHMKKKYTAVFRIRGGMQVFVAGFSRGALPQLSQADGEPVSAMVEMLTESIEEEGDEPLVLESNEPNWASGQEAERDCSPVPNGGQVSKRKPTERDYDAILDRLKTEHGWGDGIDGELEEFESSRHCRKRFTDEQFADAMHRWLYHKQTGC